MVMIIRLARPEDLAALVAIYNQAIPDRQATADLEPVTVTDRQGWFDRHDPDRHPLWVGEVGGEVVGWLGLQPFYGRPAYAGTAEVSIYIHPQHQGQGYGDALMREAIVQAPHLGLTCLLGFIFAHNHPSLDLFQKHHFQLWGYLPQVARLDERWGDLAIYGLQVMAPQGNKVQ